MYALYHEQLSAEVEIDEALTEVGVAPFRLKMRRKIFDTLILGFTEGDRLREWNNTYCRYGIRCAQHPYHKEVQNSSAFRIKVNVGVDRAEDTGERIEISLFALFVTRPNAAVPCTVHRTPIAPPPGNARIV